MSETKNVTSALDAMLAQYEENNKPKYDKKDKKEYDLKNYFSTFMEKGVDSVTKEIRILPSSDGNSPFIEMHVHKALVDGKWTTYPCLQHEKDEPCPFCEARLALLSTGDATDKELAKKYNSKLMYVVKVIDRNAEADGVKFWRFGHDYRKTGIYDKIHGVLTSLKKDKDFTSATHGRDLSLTINRDTNKNPVVSAVVAQDVTPLSEDATKSALWLADKRTWEDVYSVRSYDFLEIVVKGGIPVWDKVNKKFADKVSLKATEEAGNLESELTVGVENVKNTVKAATHVEPVTVDEEQGSDLPF